MNGQEKLPTKATEGNFTIGDRPDVKKALEQFKDQLSVSESETQLEIPVSKSNTTSPRHFVAASVAGTEQGGKTRMMLATDTGKQFPAVSGSKNFPRQLDKYKIAAPDETYEKFKERLFGERIEAKAAEIEESAARFEASGQEKKKIWDEMMKETDPKRKKQLWQEKNYFTLEHQKNGAASAYKDAKNDVGRNHAKENFITAKKILAEYVDDPELYEKNHNWEYRGADTQKMSAEESQKNKEDIAVPQEKETPLSYDDQNDVDDIVTKKEPDASETVSAPNEIKERATNVLQHIENLGDAMTTEEKDKVLNSVETFRKTLDEQASATEKEAEKKGYLDTIRAIGEHYKKARLTYKGALALAVLAGVSSGGVAALLGVSIGMAARVGGGAAVFVGAEALLEKKRQEKERWWNKNPKIIAMLSAGVLSGAIGKTISATGADEWLSNSWEQVFGDAQVVTPDATPETITPEPTQPPQVSPEENQWLVESTQLEASGTIHPVVFGDNLHNIIGGIKELNELDGGRKENAIANIIAHINKNPVPYGIASGDVDHLAVGDHINMAKIHKALADIKINGESVVEHAKRLTPEQIERIEEFRPENDVSESVSQVSTLDTERTENKPLSSEEINDKDMKMLDEMERQVNQYGKGGEASVDTKELDISDEGIKNINNEFSATEMTTTGILPDGIQRDLERDIFGVEERELADTEWATLQNEKADTFLDDFYVWEENSRAKLWTYLRKVVEHSGISPDSDETVLDYLARAGEKYIASSY
jgi:hypothetical protein